jgi:hypothetical protein
LLGNPPPQQAPQQPGQPPPDQAQQPGAKPPSPADQKRLAQNSTPPQADTSDDSVSKLPKPAEPPKGAAVA